MEGGKCRKEIVDSINSGLYVIVLNIRCHTRARSCTHTAFTRTHALMYPHGISVRHERLSFLGMVCQLFVTLQKTSKSIDFLGLPCCRLCNWINWRTSQRDHRRPSETFFSVNQPSDYTEEWVRCARGWGCSDNREGKCLRDCIYNNN